MTFVILYSIYVIYLPETKTKIILTEKVNSELNIVLTYFIVAKKLDKIIVS